MLKSQQTAQSFAVAADFKSTFARPCRPYFIGVWDTVSSVGWAWDPLHVPYTAKNPDLSIGRHAVSIDERRCFFRQNLWGAALGGQDIKQVWFAGVHSDVGGGYAEAESGLSKIALEWMMVEAFRAGLVLDPVKVALILGCAGGNYAAPAADAPMHKSLNDWWMLLEPLPHRYVDTRVHPPQTKVRFPMGRRRFMEPGVAVHESVERRIGLGIGYRPPNLPPKHDVEPWIRWSAARQAPAT